MARALGSTTRKAREVKIAAVCTAYHEADIIGYTIQHLLAHGEAMIVCHRLLSAMITHRHALRLHPYRPSFLRYAYNSCLVTIRSMGR